MEIILATPEDQDAIFALMEACKQQMALAGIHQWEPDYPNLDDVTLDIAAESAYVAKDGMAIAGVVTLDHTMPPEYLPLPWRIPAKQVMVVHRLAVAPRRWGLGVAKALMGYAEDLGCQRGCQAVRLDAYVYNPAALALYTRLGYRRVGTVTFRQRLFYCFEHGLPGEG